MNIMSLGGLALGIGMLVDNAIVVLESIYRCRQEGDDGRTATLRGTAEVGSAVAASTLTSIAVFFPMVFVEGIAGQLFGDLGLTVVFSLLASLAVALFFIPMISSRQWAQPGGLTGGGDRLGSTGALWLSTLLPRAAARGFREDLATLRAFRDRHGDIILKPLYGNGGAGVFKLHSEDGNLASLHEMFTGISREPLIVQKFLPAVTKGDKRGLLVDGGPVGAINRVPAKGETRSNMHVGGRPEKVELTDRDREICAAIGPLLREKGQILVGIDVIGDWLTEINVTSPTGIQELERFDGINVAAKIWEAIEAKR